MAANKDEPKIDDKSESEYNIDTEDAEFAVVDEDGRTEDALTRLKKRLKDCEREKQDYLDGWQRARADIQNIRNTHARESAGQRARAQEEVIEAVLGVLDSFDHALAQERGADNHEWRTGVERIRAQLTSALKQFDVVRFESLGETFDPARHEPLATEPTDEKELDNTVAAVLQEGYERGERVIRPAKVRVYSRDDA